MPFASIVGHTHVVTLLRRAVAAGRVPQSLLIAGPDGVGKRTLALALAQAVNCPRRRDGDACGVCPTCQRIARGQHSDVTLVTLDGEASIKIDKIRERVLHVVGYRPFEAERRVYIIDPAEEDFPFTGRTRFEDVRGQQSETVGRAETVANAYRTRFKAHAEAVGALARRLGWTYIAHRTDRSPQTALIALYADMSGA